MICLVGPANCVAATGLPWRRVRDAAVRLGVRRVRVGRATLVPLGELLEAIECDGRRVAVAQPTPVDAREQVLLALGRGAPR